VILQIYTTSLRPSVAAEPAYGTERLITNGNRSNLPVSRFAVVEGARDFWQGDLTKKFLVSNGFLWFKVATAMGILAVYAVD
jgi:hypothetical protein